MEKPLAMLERLTTALVARQLLPEDSQGSRFADAIHLATRCREFRILALTATRAAGGPIRIVVNNSPAMPSGRWVHATRTIEVNIARYATLEEQLATIVFELANACRRDCFESVQAKFEANVGTKRPRIGPVGAGARPLAAKLGWLGTPELASRAYEFVEYQSCKSAARVQMAIAALPAMANASADAKAKVQGHATIANKSWSQHWTTQAHTPHRQRYDGEFSALMSRIIARRKAARQAAEAQRRRNHYVRFIQTLTTELDKNHLGWRQKLGFPGGVLDPDTWYPALARLDRDRGWLNPVRLNNAEECARFRTLFIPRRFRNQEQ